MLGILDSGLGGLTVWKELKNLSPEKGVLYFADSARAPYGNLSKEKIFIYAKESIDHLIDLGATHIAIACHTIATTVGPLLRHSSKVPLFDIASHSIPLLSPLEKIALIGTRATVTSKFYDRFLGNKLVSITACPNLVPMIENGTLDNDIVEKSLEPINKDATALFLACTHFPLIKDIIQSFCPHMSLIDPSHTFAKALLPYAKIGPDEFFTTGNPTHFHSHASIFCREKKVAFPFLIKSLYSPLIT
jgi:glutamate racemase